MRKRSCNRRLEDGILRKCQNILRSGLPLPGATVVRSPKNKVFGLPGYRDSRPPGPASPLQNRTHACPDT
eukprot:2866325-Rhodomonas_salina.2